MTLDPHDLGTILGVWAHPDDEAWLSAGLMATATDDDRRVVCVTATKGEAGFPDGDTRSIVERKALRASECATCLKVLGVTEHHWFDYPDGGCRRVEPAEPVAKLTALIEEVQPDTVLTFGPDGMTGHDDHIAVSRWTTQALRQAPAWTTDAPSPARLLYATKTADWNRRFSASIDPAKVMMIEGMEPPGVEAEALAVSFRAEGQLLDRKLQALRAQASQIEPLYEMVGELAFGELIAEEFFRNARADEWS